MASSATTQVSVAQAPKVAAPASAAVQRQCECGRHTLSSECDDCKQKKTLLQRSADGRFSPPVVPRVVRDVLGENGSPLDFAVREQLQSYFSRNFSGMSVADSEVSLPQTDALELGPPDDEFERDARNQADTFTRRPWRPAAPASGRKFDFSRVRVHTGPAAAEAARAVNAKAFTVGRHVVFGAGQYSPRSPEGRGLIAHELTHVLQQQNGAARPRVQRAAAINEIGRFLRNVFLFIPYLFGLDIPFSDDELHEYLDTINQKDKIEGGFFSDDRARAVVAKWKAGSPDFRLGLNTKKLLILEMLDGTVTDGDRDGILDLLDGITTEEGADQMSQILGPGKVELKDLNRAMSAEPYSGRFNVLLLEGLAIPTDALALKIIQDIRDVKDQSKFDFENLQEMHDEIFKRMRVSQLMDESQRDNAFDYPENMKASDNCGGFVPGTAGYTQNARVNLNARDYWTSVIQDPTLVYYFDLTPVGKDNAFDALLKLFTPHNSICDRTLIHCDYLINVIEFRAYAETIGREEFNKKVKNGAISMVLSYSGFPKPGAQDPRTSPKAFAYQNVVPASKEDLVIGDHVMFWNHLAYDGLNSTKQMPWRLENAVLVDKDEKGKDLFEGHGTPRRTEHDMLGELADAYNPFAEEALNLAKAADGGDQGKLAQLNTVYPLVTKQDDKWIVTDPGIYGDTVRAGRTYDLRTVDKSHMEDDPLLIGLRDPHEPSKMGPVERPIESAPGPAPRP